MCLLSVNAEPFSSEKLPQIYTTSFVSFNHSLISVFFTNPEQYAFTIVLCLQFFNGLLLLIFSFSLSGDI